jgi:hypothetical protein
MQPTSFDFVALKVQTFGIVIVHQAVLHQYLMNYNRIIVMVILSALEVSHLLLGILLKKAMGAQ